MPGAHRHGDSRYCGASTIVSGQSNVYVNNKLWAVEGDQNNHAGGQLVASYGDKNVRINGKRVICAAGDKAQRDYVKRHNPPITHPKGHSYDVIVYGGRAGGG